MNCQVGFVQPFTCIVLLCNRRQCCIDDSWKSLSFSIIDSVSNRSFPAIFILISIFETRRKNWFVLRGCISDSLIRNQNCLWMRWTPLSLPIKFRLSATLSDSWCQNGGLSRVFTEPQAKVPWHITLPILTHRSCYWSVQTIQPLPVIRRLLFNTVFIPLRNAINLTVSVEINC